MSSSFESLLKSSPNISERNDYTYYRNSYTNPAVGDIVKMIYYSDDYNWLALVTNVVKNGVYKLISVVWKNGYGGRTRNDLAIAHGASESLWSRPTKNKEANFLSMQILDLQATPTTSAITSEIVNTLYSKTDFDTKMKAFAVVYDTYLSLKRHVELSSSELLPLLFDDSPPNAREIKEKLEVLSAAKPILLEVTVTMNKHFLSLFGYHITKALNIPLYENEHIVESVLSIVSLSDKQIDGIVDALNTY